MDNASATKLSLELPDAAAGSPPPAAFRILPPNFTARVKGVVRKFSFTDASAARVMEAAKAWGNKHSSDWEHAALTAGARGTAAPASAWYDLEVRRGDDGPELWAINVTWTPDAATQLAKKEYRYFSPAFTHTDEGEVTEFVNLALTNLPATNHMKPLAASKGAAAPHDTTPEYPTTMKTVLSALHLGADSSEAQALSAVTSLSQAQTTLLSLTGKATVEEAFESVKAGRAAVEKVAALSASMEELQGQVKASEVEKLMAQGKADKRITPALEAFCRELGETDVTLLSKFLAGAAPALQTPTRETSTEIPSALSAETLEMARKLGHDIASVERNARAAGLIK